MATNDVYLGNPNLKMYDKRVDENRKFIKDTIVEEVYKQIKFVMPKQSGGVFK